MQMKMKISKY